jgi:TonB family protein
VRLTREEAVKEKMAALHRQLLAEHLKEVARNANEGEGDEGTSAARRHSAGNGGGPVLGSVETAGSGYGIGPGTGSAGVLKSPEFVMYYRAVQERIKKNWSFWGGNNSLTATVYFAIGSDGQLTAAPRVTQSSRDNAYDESVLRAIQRAAPFPAPPEECRELFGRGVEATFKLGDLNS